MGAVNDPFSGNISGDGKPGFMVLTLRTTAAPAGQRPPLCMTTTGTMHIKFTAILCAASDHGIKSLAMARKGNLVIPGHKIRIILFNDRGNVHDHTFFRST